jgi:hypothetical protein
MPDTAVAADILEPGDILRNLPSELTFDRMITVDYLGDSADLIFGKLVRANVRLYADFVKYLSRQIFPDTMDIRQRNQYYFVIRYINTNYTRHIQYSNKKTALALSLFVARVYRTDYPHNALATNDFAILAYSFYRTSYFHNSPFC